MDVIDEIVDVVGIERRSVELIRLHISFRGLSLSITEVRRIRLDEPAFVDQPALFVDICLQPRAISKRRSEIERGRSGGGRGLVNQAFGRPRGPAGSSDTGRPEV